MNTVCEATIGTLPIDYGAVLNCAIYENSGFVPYGKISFIDTLHYFDDDFDFQTYSKFTITISNLDESNNKTKRISFTGDIIACSLKRDKSNQSTMVVDLTFINRGDNSKLFTSIAPMAIPSSNSITAIQQICKTAGITCNVSGINTNDSMNWLIVNHNLLTALNFITDHSYIDDDALTYSIKLDGTVIIRSMKTTFAQDPLIQFTPYQILDIPNDSIDVIYYYDSQSANNSGILQESFSVASKSAISDPGQNKIVTKNQGVAPGSDGGDRGTNNTNKTRYAPQKSPQTHENYGIAPDYRKSVLATYSRTMNFSCVNESYTSIGDLINVNDGIYHSNSFVQSNINSGKYIITKKAYHFNIDGHSKTLTTFIQAVKDKTIYNNPTADKIRNGK